MGCSGGYGGSFFFFFWVFGKEKYWIAIQLYYRSGKSMKIRIKMGLIKICVNMDEEKNRGKRREKRRREAREKEKEKKGREKSQLTLGQWMGPTNN